MNKAIIVAGALLFILAAFMLGTVVGFNTAITHISNCQEVECTDLGIDADTCEICSAERTVILKR